MKIASNTNHNGMAGGQAFKDAITKTIKENGSHFIIETGTYLGQGTTQAIISGMGESANLITIEVNPEHANIARRNIDDPRVTILNGLSVPRDLLPKRLALEDLPDTVFIDHQEHERERLYQKEVSHRVADNMLATAMSVSGNYSPNFILLDSAGHMGYQEWGYVMALYRGDEFILALDDTNHLKHYKTVQQIKQDSRFKLLWDTKEKFGSAIYRFKK